jgi:hypothetical protein
MQWRPTISGLLCVGLFLSSSQAQTGDWQAAQAIPFRSQISLKSQHGNFRCILQKTTDTELFCEHGSLGTIRFDRQDIRQVRLEHPDANASLGAVIGTGLGAASGVALTKGSKDAEIRVYTPIYMGIGIGVLLGVIMSKIPILRGKVVYRQ